jgi:xylulokinase
VHQVENPDFLVARGAAMLAFQRLGLLGFEDIASRVVIRREYHPDPAHRALYADRAARLVEAFKRTRPLFRALNDEDRNR